MENFRIDLLKVSALTPSWVRSSRRPVTRALKQASQQPMHSPRERSRVCCSQQFKAPRTFRVLPASDGKPPAAPLLILLSKYVGEVLGQYARFVTDREAGRLIAERVGAEASSRLSNDLAVRATSIGATAASYVLRDTKDVSTAWTRIVARAFEVGRTLPRDAS